VHVLWKQVRKGGLRLPRLRLQANEGSRCGDYQKRKPTRSVLNLILHCASVSNVTGEPCSAVVG
jgi:hypothetical protein